MKRLCLYPIGLLMFLLLLNACSQEETPSQEDNPKEQGSIPLGISLEQMALQDLNDEPVRTAISHLSSMGGTTTSKNMGSNLYDFTVDTSMVKVITHDDVKSYTFPIKRDHNDGSFFENLVLQRNPSGNLQAFLVRYHLKDGIRALAEHGSFSFEGRRELFSLDLERLDVGLVEKNDTCYDVVELWCHFGGNDHPAGEMCILEAQLTGDDRLFYKESMICLSWGSGSGIPEGPDPGNGEGGNGGGAGFEDPYIITAPTNVALYEFQLKEFASGKLSQAERGYYNSDPNIKNIVDGYLIDNGISNLAMFKAKNHLSLGHDLSLTPQKFVWYFQHRDSGEVEDLKQYLQDQSNSAKARAFGKESISAWMDNGEVDFEEEIIYLLEGYPCQKNIIQEALAANSPVTDLVRDIFNSNVKPTITIQANNLNGILEGGNTHAQNGNPLHYFITMNTQRLDVSTDIDIACITIHESVHALLFYFLQAGSFQSNNESYAQLVEDFVTYWVPNGGIGSPEIQHQYMQNLVSIIADSLYNWALKNDYNPDNFDVFDTVDSHNFDGMREYFGLIAWNGLTDRDAFKELYPPGTLSYISALQIINSESFPYEYNANPQGEPCN
ncbi:hypothetical protein [Flagellimonas sediminis]|uniref:Uncharacterized protein n=1 Tax=Flagellimonas sediminis TaxID=2696468 RepID=A0A6I5KNB9_9FLAO|nr:hypothetical protein [Allomuricauda sediminis]NDV41977.1 hypothetical protein [Allomuricauda sediminis]